MAYQIAAIPIILNDLWGH